MALKACLAPGDTVAVQLPVYPPMLHAAGHRGLNRLDLHLKPAPDGTYSVIASNGVTPKRDHAFKQRATA
jgi:cystathionine beta-lyase